MSDILTDANFNKFRTFIYDESGITFSDSNRPILESRLRERLRHVKMDDLGAYFDKLQKDPQELKEFLDSITTNLTRFFRNQAHFDAMEKHVIPNLVAYKKAKGLEKRIRVWSAGCSTGEEPYTIAMVLKETLPPDFTFDVMASDLSLKCLMTASQGFYPEARSVGIPEGYLTKYFNKMGDGFQVKEDLKARIKFDYHNLKNEPANKAFDIVFCRNVLIYFDEAAQKAVIDRFWNAMNPHSFLYIGHSESLFGMNTQFKFLKTDWAVLYTKLVEP